MASSAVSASVAMKWYEANLRSVARKITARFGLVALPIDFGGRFFGSVASFLVVGPKTLFVAAKESSRLREEGCFDELEVEPKLSGADYLGTLTGTYTRKKWYQALSVLKDARWLFLCAGTS